MNTEANDANAAPKALKFWRSALKWVSIYAATFVIIMFTASAVVGNIGTSIGTSLVLIAWIAYPTLIMLNSNRYKLGKKISILFAFIALSFILISASFDEYEAIKAGYTSSTDRNLAKSGGFQDAVTWHRADSLGFTSLADMQAAAKAGFRDGASWSKHLADVAAQEQLRAAEAKEAREAANKAAEQAALASDNTASQSQEEQADGGDGSRAVRVGKRLPGICYEIMAGCRKFVPANRACAAADDYGSCMERMGDDTWYADKDRCTPDGGLQAAEASICS